MLRIIESTHGDVNFQHKQYLFIFGKLSNENYEYQLYAKYWAIHIETERDIFTRQI